MTELFSASCIFWEKHRKPVKQFLESQVWLPWSLACSTRSCAKGMAPWPQMSRHHWGHRTCWWFFQSTPPKKKYKKQNLTRIVLQHFSIFVGITVVVFGNLFLQHLQPFNFAPGKSETPRRSLVPHFSYLVIHRTTINNRQILGQCCPQNLNQFAEATVVPWPARPASVIMPAPRPASPRTPLKRPYGILGNEWWHPWKSSTSTKNDDGTRRGGVVPNPRNGE